MSRLAFWPGYRWRVLAHKKATASKKPDYLQDHRWDVRSDQFDTPIEFDELVIDDWFHLEQMDKRCWWMGVGNGDDYWHIYVVVDGKGKATVSMEKQ